MIRLERRGTCLTFVIPKRRARCTAGVGRADVPCCSGVDANLLTPLLSSSSEPIADSLGQQAQPGATIGRFTKFGRCEDPCVTVDLLPSVRRQSTPTNIKFWIPGDSAWAPDRHCRETVPQVNLNGFSIDRTPTPAIQRIRARYRPQDVCRNSPDPKKRRSPTYSMPAR